MRHQVWVRPFNAKDEAEVRLFFDWLYAAREKNRFDPEIFKRGQVRILTCFNETGIVGFVPVAVAFLLESLAFRPGIERTIQVKALEAMQHYLVHWAFQENVPDAFFFTTDADLLKLAQNPRYGWIRPDVPMLNLHFADLEAKS